MKKQRSATEGKANGCANRVESRACSSYPEVKPAIDEVNEETTFGDRRESQWLREPGGSVWGRSGTTPP